MSFEGIIITGTSCAGKSTIAKALCDSSDNKVIGVYEVVKAVTTRIQRPDDFNFEYLNDTQFSILKDQGELMLDDTYRNKYYGIKFEEYMKVLAMGKIPIIITSSSVAKFLLEQYKGRFICFFIDATDEELCRRFKVRENRVIDKEELERFHKINELDRKNADKAHYVIYNNELTASISLIQLLWEYRICGGILSSTIIKLNY